MKKNSDNKLIDPNNIAADPMKCSDKVLVRDLRLETIIGLFPWEREVRQTLFVDLDIATDISQAAATDDLQRGCP